MCVSTCECWCVCMCACVPVRGHVVFVCIPEFLNQDDKINES